MTRWYVEARTNSTLAIADTAIELTMERLTLRKLFNDVGTWLLQLRTADPHAATFMRQSGGYPNGILVWVDNEDGQGKQLVMSGPQRGSKIALTAQNEKILYVNGVSDEYWLYKRLALPNVLYDYTSTISSALGGGALRQYALAETSGTVATDSSSHAQNGTYQGGFTLNQTSLIDDPGGAVLLNGTSGDISVPTTGLPTGNNPWTVCAWGMLSANPAAEADLGGFGTNASKQGVHFGVLSTGKPFYAPYLVTATSGATAVSLNVPFLLAVTWDGTTMTGYLCQNNVVSVFGTSTPGALSVTYGTCLFGAGVGPANFWTKFIQQCGFYGAALTNANINYIYAYGLSRFAEANYTSVGVGGNVASSSLILLVNYNAGSLALPATTFTNVYSTHTARPVPLLTTATDPLIGSDIIGLARFDILLDMLAALALQSSPELGFKLEQSGANLVFTVYQPPDLTGTAIFSHDLYGATGNVLDYTWEHQAGTSTHIIAGGANPVGGSANLNQRLFGENEDATAITRFGYLETFLDFRQAPDGPTLQQAIAGKLASDKETLNINLNVIDQPGVLYFKGPSGKGYDLGSKVTVILDGQVFTEIIREVDIDLQGSQPAQVMAAIGTPLSAAIINEYTTMVKRLADAGYRVHALDTNY